MYDALFSRVSDIRFHGVRTRGRDYAPFDIMKVLIGVRMSSERKVPCHASSELILFPRVRYIETHTRVLDVRVALML